MRSERYDDAIGLDLTEGQAIAVAVAVAVPITCPWTTREWRCFSTAASINISGCRIAVDRSTTCPNASSSPQAGGLSVVYQSW